MSAAKTAAEPQTWVNLKHPSTNDKIETVSAFCSFIEKFLWRPNDEGDNELFIIINNPSGPRHRYKYHGVSRDVFEEAWDRAHNPGDYSDNFGSWYNREISEKYEYDRFE